MLKFGVQVVKLCPAVGSDALEVAVSLFEYGGQLGDINSSYTFAQLLRTGRLGSQN